MTINLGRELDRWMWGEQYETDGDIPTQAHAIPHQHQSSVLMGKLLDVCMEQCLSCPALHCLGQTMPSSKLQSRGTQEQAEALVLGDIGWNRGNYPDTYS